jgi:hypothetical protein
MVYRKWLLTSVLENFNLFYNLLPTFVFYLVFPSLKFIYDIKTGISKLENTRGFYCLIKPIPNIHKWSENDNLGPTPNIRQWAETCFILNIVI